MLKDMRFGAGLGVTCAILLSLSAAPAEATLSEALSLRELVAQSDVIVLATCVDQRALRDSRERIVTDYSLRVEETMSGSAPAGGTLTMRRLGGELGDLGMRIEGEPRLMPGERYVIFLRRVGAILRPVGMSQGVLPVEDRGGALTVHPGGAGLGLVQRARGGQLVPAPAALLHPEPWERIRERVTDLVNEAP